MPATALQPTHARARLRPPRAGFAAFGAFALIATGVAFAGISGAATTVGLGAAESFGVLGASTVTNTGPTTIDGDLGVRSDAANALTGFDDVDGGPGMVTGAIHAGDKTAQDAQDDALTAFGALASQPCDPLEDDLTGQDLGGLTLTPDVYCFSSSAQLTGPLTLDALGDPAAVFIIRVASTLTTATASSVQFTDDFASCNVFWQVGSSATLGTETDFVGTLIAHTSITADTDATVEGRLIALNGAVTLDRNVVTASSCATDEPPGDGTPVDGTPVDEDPVDETPVEGTPVDDTPVDDTPVDHTPVDDTPVGETPVDEGGDETPDGGAPSDAGPVDDAGEDAVGGGSAVPVATTGGPAAPERSTGAPGDPGLTGAPGVPDGPRSPLPSTGSDITLAAFGALAMLLGAGMVLLVDARRTDPGRS